MFLSSMMFAMIASFRSTLDLASLVGFGILNRNFHKISLPRLPLARIALAMENTPFVETYSILA